MTVKQIAEVTGKKERAVHNWVARVSANNAQVSAKIAEAKASSKPADYTLDETCLIIESGMGKNAAGIFRANADKQMPTISDSEVDRLFKLAMASLTTMVESLNTRINKIETQQETRKALLPPPGKPLRAELSEVVRKLASKEYGNDFQSAWRYLYNELLYRSHINVTVRAKNEGVKAIDIIERENLLDVSISIIVEALSQVTA